jgi:tetratricopeptide (TPR) repeat protein
MKKLLFFAVVLLFTVTTVTFAQNVAENYKKGKNFYDKKQYQPAVAQFDEVLKQDQMHLMGLFYRGVSHYYLKNYEQTIADLDKAIEMYPVRADFYYYRALARKEMKDLTLSYSDLSSAIALDDKQPDYFYERAKIGLQLGEANTAAEKGETEQTDVSNAVAIMDLDKALALNPKLQGEVSQKRRETFSKLTEQEIDLLPLTASGRGGANPPVNAPDDAKTVEFKKYIVEHKFETLQDGKSFYDKLYLETLPNGKKSTVLALLKTKVLKDVFGENPYPEDLERMKQTLDREFWLAPEGRDYYFKLAQNSKYIFSGGVQRGKVYYFYKAAKSKNSDLYRLQVYGVLKGESNLVYDSQIAYQEDTLKRTIQVFASQNAGYKWNIDKNNYMKAESDLANSNLTFSPTGSLVVIANDNKHGVPKDKYVKAVKAVDKTSQAAIKATMHYVILDYVKMLYKPSWWSI